MTNDDYDQSKSQWVKKPKVIDASSVVVIFWLFFSVDHSWRSQLASLKSQR